MDSALSYELYPLGEEAVVIRWRGEIGERTRRLADATERLLEYKKPAAVVEWVRAYTTVTVFYDPWLVYKRGIGMTDNGNTGSDASSPYEIMCGWLRRELETIGSSISEVEELEAELAKKETLEREQRAESESMEQDRGREVNAGKRTRAAVVIPVWFGGEAGPDLLTVADRAGLSPEETVTLYCSAEYTVHMIGFAPGFPYMGGLPERLGCARRSEPRTLVPAGSVGIAGRQTGIYPLATPGGWQLIGRTPLRLFDPKRPQPSLLAPGDRVRFEAIPQERYVELLRS